MFFSQIEKLILVLPAEKVEGEMRDMWKRREENSAEMERKWVQEQEVMEAEFKKMADWRAQAEKGLAELEDEKEKWSAKCGDLEAENERLQEMVRTAGEKLELSVARAAEAASSVTILDVQKKEQKLKQLDKIVQMQKEKPIVTSPRRKSSSIKFTEAVGENDEVVGLEDIEVAGTEGSDDDENNRDDEDDLVDVKYVIAGGQSDDLEDTVTPHYGAAAVLDDNNEEFMEVLADIVEDDAMGSKAEVSVR